MAARPEPCDCTMSYPARHAHLHGCQPLRPPQLAVQLSRQRLLPPGLTALQVQHILLVWVR